MEAHRHTAQQNIDNNRLKNAYAANYKVVVRSFHPEKNFGWTGLNFEGDDRGFSLQPNNTGAVTSRIWHEFIYNSKSGTSSIAKAISDPSKATWQKEETNYDQIELRPRHSKIEHPSTYGNSEKTIISNRLRGKYWGANHAMPGSQSLQKNLGGTYVPEIDVDYELITTLDIEQGHLDIAIRVDGDGFPNTEAFIVDPGGQAVFLGTHVRWGAAATTLTLNFRQRLISAVIRLPLGANGNFRGTLEDELARHRQNASKRPLYTLAAWNQKHAQNNPNAGHCLGWEQIEKIKECF